MTKKQHALLRFIHAYLKLHGASPSYDEMREHLGIQSRGTISGLVATLRARGLITVTEGQHRSIELAVPPPPPALPEIIEKLKTASAEGLITDVQVAPEYVVSLPFVPFAAYVDAVTKDPVVVVTEPLDRMEASALKAFEETFPHRIKHVDKDVEFP